MDEHQEEKVFQYLDGLRESGSINMFGAVPLIVSAFCIPRQEASSVLIKWMETFDQRHREQE